MVLPVDENVTIRRRGSGCTQPLRVHPGFREPRFKLVGSAAEDTFKGHSLFFPACLFIRHEYFELRLHVKPVHLFVGA
jgi:hypothetical protein